MSELLIQVVAQVLAAALATLVTLVIRRIMGTT